MVKTSSLTHYEVVQRLHEIKAKAATLYYYMQEQEIEEWLAYCDMDAAINKLYEMVDDFAGAKYDAEGKIYYDR